MKSQKKNAIRAFSHGTLLGRANVFTTCTNRSIETLKAYLARQQQPRVRIDSWMGNLVLDIHAQLTMSRPEQRYLEFKAARLG